jgi:hypothetical protein
MVIREEQMRTLSKAAEQAFQLQLVREMHEFAPWHAKALGDDGLLRCVQFAVQRAKKYGFTNRGPIRLYLQIIFLLGAEFDSDALLPWVGKVLSDPSILNQTDRATSLYEGLTEYLNNVAGPGRKFAKEALVRARDELYSLRLNRTAPRGCDEVGQMIFAKVQGIYPEKCAYAGDAAVSQSIAFGISVAAKHSVVSYREQCFSAA